MEVSCSNCPARFAIPEEKIRGRKVRISCKRCGSPIVVDGTALGDAGAAAPKPAAQAPKPAAQAPKPAAQVPKPVAAAPKPAAAAPKPAATTPKPVAAAPKPAVAAPAKPAPSAAKPAAKAEDDWGDVAAEPKQSGWREPAASSPGIGPGSPRPSGAARIAAGAGSVTQAQKAALKAKRTMLGVAPPAAPAPPPPPEPEDDGEPEWTVALTDEHHEEMRTGELVELYFRGSIDHETFIWADGMEDWKRPWEIPMIAAELSARGLSPPSAGDDEDAAAAMLADAEPDHDEATMVASVRFAVPSSRGGAPSVTMADSRRAAKPLSSASAPLSGWREPGRADGAVSFDDATVSVDSRQAQNLMASAVRGAAAAPPRAAVPRTAPAAAPPPPPPPPPPLPAFEAEESFDDVATTVHEEEGLEAPPSAGSADVDDLLSDMEPTMAMEDAFKAESRPLSARPLPYDQEEDTTSQEQGLIGARHDDSNLFSLEKLSSEREPELPAAEPNLFEGFDFAMPSARSQPLDSLIEPTVQQPAPVAAPLEQAIPSAPLGPPPLEGAAPAKKKSRGLGCFLTLLFLLALLGAAAGASYYLKQPASLYGPDGMPKLPISL